MDKLFEKRMKLVSDNGSVGEKLVVDSNVIEDKIFKNDMNYRVGFIYDWDMRPLEEVEFKFEKIKTFSFEKSSVEYMVRFKPNYNPESRFKRFHFRNDEKERLGFYLDVYDYSKECYEKWLIVGKDDRVAFDRYNVLKCNWYFEWIKNGKYYNCLGVLRDANDSSFNSTNSDKIGGTRVSGSTSFILPYNETTSSIIVGDSFVFSDNISFPQVYKVNQMKDNATLGVIRYYTKQDLFNRHKDYVGQVNDVDIKFTFETPIPDLPLQYGGDIHMLCDAIYEAVDDEEVSKDILEISDQYIYVNGSPVSVSGGNSDSLWRFYLDGQEFSLEDLNGYLDIEFKDDVLLVRAVNKALAKYKLEICVEDPSTGLLSDKVSTEVRL